MDALPACLLAACLSAAPLPDDFTPPPAPGPYVGPSEAGAAHPSGQPLIMTTYFYWYDVETLAHVRDPDGTDALTDHPPTLDGFSYKNVGWHERQLEDMTAAGVDVLLPVYWGDPLGGHGWSDEGLPPLAAARKRLLARGVRPPAIGMFYDTSTLRHNRGGHHVDLRTAAGRRWFSATIRNFFSLVPPEHRAAIDGRPVVMLYSPAFAAGVDEQLFPAAQEAFRRRFGARMFLIKMRGWPGQADAEYQWGGALAPRFLDVAAFGPGYDHSAVPGRAPLKRDREGGAFYRRAWEQLLAMPASERPWLVHLETWNELHEGTEICETREYGRQYIELTRRYADRFHQRPGVETRGAARRGLR